MSVGEIKYKRINATADGDNEIIAAVTGVKLRVLSYTLGHDNAAKQKLVWKSGANVLADVWVPTGDSVTPAERGGLLETNAGEALNLNMPAGVDGVGHLSYVEVS